MPWRESLPYDLANGTTYRLTCFLRLPAQALRAEARDYRFFFLRACFSSVSSSVLAPVPVLTSVPVLGLSSVSDSVVVSCRLLAPLDRFLLECFFECRLRSGRDSAGKGKSVDQSLLKRISPAERSERARRTRVVRIEDSLEMG